MLRAAVSRAKCAFSVPCAHRTLSSENFCLPYLRRGGGATTTSLIPLCGVYILLSSEALIGSESKFEPKVVDINPPLRVLLLPDSPLGRMLVTDPSFISAPWKESELREWGEGRVGSVRTAPFAHWMETEVTGFEEEGGFQKDARV